MKSSVQIERYLEHHAFTEPLPARRKDYRFVLTIPAFDEHPEFLDRLLANVSTDGLLVILVVNVPDDADPDSVGRTRALQNAMDSRPGLLVIDRVTEPIPRRQGVGLARRLAADLACALISRGDVACPYIFMTDADVSLPPGYFEATEGVASEGSVLFPFEHHSETARLQQAADVYELHLRHYVEGLLAAGSPYAHQSLGSTIAIHATTYARVRGVPMRNAGEDFYLLNKAAKVDPIVNLASPRIAIEGRPSHRVVFGTGPALASMPDDVEKFVSYSPRVFEDLSAVLRGFEDFSLGDPFPELDHDLEQALAELGWNPASISNQRPPGPRRLRAAMEWFDGFRTMRFVRLMEKRSTGTPLLDQLRRQFQQPDADAGDLLKAFRSRETTRVSGVAAAVKTSAPNVV